MGKEGERVEKAIKGRKKGHKGKGGLRPVQCNSRRTSGYEDVVPIFEKTKQTASGKLPMGEGTLRTGIRIRETNRKKKNREGMWLQNTSRKTLDWAGAGVQEMESGRGGGGAKTKLYFLRRSGRGRSPRGGSNGKGDKGKIPSSKLLKERIG